MNQKYYLSGILLLGLLIWGFAALSVTGNTGIIPMFENGNDARHHGMHDTDHDSGYHGMTGMMNGDDHGTDECYEYETHLEDGFDCNNYETEDYCNEIASNMGC
ncbi:MAG: hypothetical protein ACXACP_10275 [Candidatus Hodarchaeales archaeon]|jgi:hypothetical protein